MNRTASSRARQVRVALAAIAAGALTAVALVAVVGATPAGAAVQIVPVSTLTPTSAANGWGTYERNTSNGDRGRNDGHTLTINGATYRTGLGVHATSTLVYSLGGRFTTFASDVGVDDEVGNRGSVRFQVWVDGVSRLAGGRMTGADGARHVSIDVTGARTLKLVVLPADGGASYDHADWAGATLSTGPRTTVPGPAPTTAPTPPATTRPTATPTTTRAAPATTITTTPPAPTPAPTAPAGCTTSQVWQNLAACGWPGPTNTGYPVGQAFAKTVSGGLVITTAGTVIDGYKISGGVQVRAKDVTIRNSWITNSAGGANGSGVVNVNPGASATIEHNLLDGLNATHTCIWHEGSSMTARANNCQGANDGIFSWATTVGTDGSGDNFTIEDNWLHAFTESAANGHVDGYQTEGAKHGVIRHNTIDVTQDQTSGISIWNSRKSSDDILVDHNLLAGGGFTVYAEDYSPSEANPAGGYSVTNTRFTDNRFSTVHYPCVGSFGTWFPRGAPTDGWHRSGNTVLETGQNVDASNPSAGGRTCS